MRPLDKGAIPIDALGNPIIVTNYTYWRDKLIDRIGYYCAYCNMPLSHSLQVEHVVPKNPLGPAPGDPLAWSNMLLACGPCNNAKSDDPVDFVTYYFPEEHNTLFPFRIRLNISNDAAFVVPTNGINPIQLAKSTATINLTALDVKDNRSNIVDIRWKKRKDAIITVEAAFEVYQLLKLVPTFDAARSAHNILQFAIPCGFFSLWFEKFENEPEVMEALINGLPGTAIICFDPANGYRPMHRNPINVADPF